MASNSKWYQLVIDGSVEVIASTPKALLIRFDRGGLMKPYKKWVPRSCVRESICSYGRRTIAVQGWWVFQNRLWDWVSDDPTEEEQQGYLIRWGLDTPAEGLEIPA